VDYSVIILSFNSERYIERSLECLIESFRALSARYEIFVIDNGSSDQSRKLIKQVKNKHKANIELIELDHNTGTTYSRNLGLSRSVGAKIIVMDSDAYVNPDVIDRLADHLDQNIYCGLAVPKLTYPDGRFQLSTDVFPTFARKLQRFLFLKKMEAGVTEEPKETQTVDYAISAFWMFPKHVMDKVGLLDEKIFYSPEDVDYCIRIWKKNYRIDYLPEVSLIHDAQEISRSSGFRINFFTLSHIKGLFYLFVKHRYFFSGQKFVTGVRNES